MNKITRHDGYDLIEKNPDFTVTQQNYPNKLMGL